MRKREYKRGYRERLDEQFSPPYFRHWQSSHIVLNMNLVRETHVRVRLLLLIAVLLIAVVNLGHGITPGLDPHHMTVLTECVREHS